MAAKDKGLPAMQVLWKALGQQPRLEDWENRPFGPGVEDGPQSGDNQDSHEQRIGIEKPGDPEPSGPFHRTAAAIFRYDIFPAEIMTGVLRRVPIQVGDNIGGLYHFTRGIDFFFASRVVACFDERIGGTWRCGFTYRTLHGHPFVGEETFSVEKDETTGEVIVAIRSWSRPKIVLARLGYPLARRIQLRAARAALDHLTSVVRDDIIAV